VASQAAALLVCQLGEPSVRNEEINGDNAPSWISVDDGAHDETLVESWLFRLRRERYQSRKSGKTHDYYVTHLADGVHAIALTTDQQLVMVRQFRAGSRRDSLETPGGLLDAGEDPCAAGARELLEETGYAGDSPELLGMIYPIPALLSMRISTVVIRNARLVAEPHLDQSEELTLELVPVKDIPSLITSGRIDHGVCVAGLLWWLMLPETQR
jgi:8-oxo-dGTP pyrophosphatase MutT (NUDIX family)